MSHSEHVHVIAEIAAKADKASEVRELLVGLVAEVRKEKGCLAYHLHVDKKNPALFYTFEDWATDADLAAHMVSVGPVIAKAMPLLASPPKITPLEQLV